MNIVTKETFLSRAKDKFGGQYCYDLSDFALGLRSDITITCPKHGEFIQTAKKHLEGKGCPVCITPKISKLTQAQYLQRCITEHGDYYDYSEVQYTGMHGKITVICKDHGPFKMMAHLFVSRGETQTKCPECYKQWNASRCALTVEQFMEKSCQVHKGFYDYSKVCYKNMNTKVVIVCPRHGDFEQQAGNHVAGHGCPKCGYESNSEHFRDSQKDFILKSIYVHGDTYGYDRVNYQKSTEPVEILCNQHGYFAQRPADHWDGHGCPKCGESVAPGAPILSFEKFLARAVETHNGKYQYVEDSYTHARGSISAICSKHGEFSQQVSNHLQGTGCPRCRTSKPQEFLTQYLESIGENVIPNDRSGVIGKGKGGLPLEVDIYLPDRKIAIEVNGLYWHSTGSPQKSRDWVINHQLLKHKQAARQGVQLIHYYEDELKYAFNKVIRHLRSVIGITEDRVYARNTSVQTVPWEDAKIFFTENHLQGPSRPMPVLGLYAQGQLVAAMSCGPSVSDRYNKREDAFELIRYATSKQVVGGASKLLMAFVRTNPQVRKIISYSDTRLSSGNLYTKLGFTCSKVVPPDYMYVVKDRRKHKSHFTRNKLASMLPRFDPELTEEANCFNHKIFRIYNCGLQRWELNL